MTIEIGLKRLGRAARNTSRILAAMGMAVGLGVLPGCATPPGPVQPCAVSRPEWIDVIRYPDKSMWFSTQDVNQLASYIEQLRVCLNLPRGQL